MSIKISPARFVAVLGLLATLALAAALPANAATTPTTHGGGGAGGGGVAAASDGMGQALIVGGVAFGLMVAAAAGVLWFTARNRGHQH